MKRTKLANRLLPDYTRGEEITNTVTHICGSAMGLLVLILCTLKSVGSATAVIAAVIYGSSMSALYTISSVYHGLRPSTGKKVMQVIDHCTIYFLIAGTYTPVMLCSMLPTYPVQAIGLLTVEWGLAITAAVFTAIDLHNYRVLSMICYIGMGWGILLFLPQLMSVIATPGFLLLLAGGIAYTIGAVLYGIGSRKRWMHSVFHVFVLAGSLLQFLSILLYVL